MIGDFSVKPTVRGERVVLRPFRDSDLPSILRALQDPEVVRLTGSSPVSWDDAARERMRGWYASRAAQTDRLDLAIAEVDGDAWAGEVVLNEVDVRNAACNFRMLVGPGQRDRGLGSEAVRLLLRYAFGTLRLHRVSLQVYAFNPRARHVYEKAGFTAEGVLRDALWTGDGWVDAVVMAALATDARHRVE